MIGHVLYSTISSVFGFAISVWASSVAIFSGAAAAWALLFTESGDEVARQMGYGAGAGFIIGIPIAVAAAIASAAGA